MNCHTVNVSKYVNYHLQLIVKEIPSYPNTLIRHTSLLFFRYIGDIFIIWKCTKAELMIFTNELNEKRETIKFDFQIPPRKMAILDTVLYKDENSNIQTTSYRKPTDEQTFLPAKSGHPKSLKNSITYSQALRLKTIFSRTTAYNKNCAIIKEVSRKTTQRRS